jgi:3-dehydroquinate synthase
LNPFASVSGSDSEVRVASAGGGYPVLVESSGLRRLPELLLRYAPGHRYAVVSDDNVGPLYGRPAMDACRRAGLAADLFEFPAGERHKTRETWSALTDRMLEAGLGRDCTVVAVGGGVTGDLAGFVAATFMRGVPVVQVPTTLVAMVDASIGGKTGVDTRAGKNLVGAFHAPRLVLADPEALGTLPERERAQGLVEAMKHGAIYDALYLEELVRETVPLLAGEPGASRAAVLRSVQIKAHVVGEDELEGGFRQVLNFGHTYGHALETESSYEMGHGQAVAWGMILEARLGERMGITHAGTAERLERALAQVGFGSPRIPPGGRARIVDLLLADKKARAGVVRFVLLRRVGEVARGEGWSHAAPANLVREVVDQVPAPG